MTTIACSGDRVKSLSKLKLDDKDNKLSKLKNLVSFDPEFDSEIAKEAGLNVYTYD